MRRLAVLAVAALAAVAFPRPGAAQIQDRATLVAALDSLARAHADEDGVAGVSVAVVRGADTLLLGGYGLVDLEWNVPTPRDASASYEIGSVTKQFTAAALLKLVEDGKVDLDADFTEYVDFDTRGHEIPVRRLLDHTSGIPGYTEMPVFGELAMKQLPRDSLVSLVEAEPFLFETWLLSTLALGPSGTGGPTGTTSGTGRWSGRGTWTTPGPTRPGPSAPRPATWCGGTRRSTEGRC